MVETVAVPLKVSSSSVPQSGAARDIYKSGYSGRRQYSELQAERKIAATESQKQQKELAKLKQDIALREREYNKELASLEREKEKYGADYEQYADKYKEVKEKEGKFISELEEKPDSIEKSTRDVLLGTPQRFFEDLMFEKNLSGVEKQVIREAEQKQRMSLGIETKRQIVESIKPKFKLEGFTKKDILEYKPPVSLKPTQLEIEENIKTNLKDLESGTGMGVLPVTVGKIVGKELGRGIGKLRSYGLQLDKDNYIKSIEEEYQASLSKEGEKQALKEYVPTRTPVSFASKKIGYGFVEKSVDPLTLGLLQSTPELRSAVVGVAQEAIDIATGISKIGEPLGYEVYKDFDKEFLKKQTIGVQSLQGANIVSDVVENIATTVGSDIISGFRGDAFKEKISGKDYSSQIAPTTKTGKFIKDTSVAVGLGLAKDLKQKPGETIGRLVGGAVIISAINQALVPGYSSVMKSSFDISKNIKTQLGVIKPIYYKTTPTGVQAIKPQTKYLTKTGFETKIKNLGYKKAVPGVVRTDTLGRQAIAIQYGNKPKFVYLVKGSGNAPYSKLNIPKTVKNYSKYFKSKKDLSSFKNILTELKTTTSPSRIYDLQAKITLLEQNTKFGARLPEIYTKQAKLGFGETFKEQEYFAGKFGSFGSGQRSLYSQFRKDPKTGAKLLRVYKESDIPLERTFFLSPYDPKTGSILLRETRLGTSMGSLSGATTIGKQPVSEGYILPSQKVANIPSRLKPLAKASRSAGTSVTSARQKFAKEFLPQQLKVTQKIQPFGFATSSESEVTLAPGSILKSEGLLTKTWIKGSVKATPIYQLSLPNINDISSTTAGVISKGIKNISTKKGYSLPQVYSTSRLLEESVLSLGVATYKTPKPDYSTKLDKTYNRIQMTPTKLSNYNKYNVVGSTDVKTYTDISSPPIKSTLPTQTSKITSTINKVYTPIGSPTIQPITRSSGYTTAPTSIPYDYKRDSSFVPTLLVSRIPESAKKRKTQKEDRTEVKRDIPFETYVRENKKWTKVDIDNKKRNKYAAMELGIKIADNTAARSWKVKKGIGTGVDIRKRRKPSTNKFYRMSKTQDPKLAGAWIEKDTHAIDTPGEIQGITAKGWINQQKGKFIKKYLGGKTKKKKRKKTNRIKAPRFKSVV